MIRVVTQSKDATEINMMVMSSGSYSYQEDPDFTLASIDLKTIPRSLSMGKQTHKEHNSCSR